MKPIRTDECNFTYHLNGGTEENDLPCQVPDPDSGEQWVRSFFVHELDEELDREALFIGVLVGPGEEPGHIPLVEVSMADIGENIALPLRSVPDPMYGQVLEGDILLTDEIRAAFRDGTPLQIKVNAQPTPPVRVYTADYATPEPEPDSVDPINGGDRVMKTITVTIDPKRWSDLLEGWEDGTTKWDESDSVPVYRDLIDPISAALARMGE